MPLNAKINKEEEKVQEAPVVEENIYWARASQFQLANYIPEIKSQQDNIQRREVPIRFTGNMYVTSDPKEIEYIEASEAFENGSIKKCKNRAEAQELTRGLIAMKGVREIKTETVQGATRKASGTK